MEQVIKKISDNFIPIKSPYGWYEGQRPRKHNFEKLFFDKAAVYTIEKQSGNWFRILRLKNNARTHDVIINDLNKGIFHIEGSNSSVTSYKATVEDLRDFFVEASKQRPFYRAYTRGTNSAKYSVVNDSIMTCQQVADLFKF